MHRYVTLIWDVADLHQSSTAQYLSQRLRIGLPTWTIAAETEGLLVMHAGAKARQSQVYPLEARAGVVLGKLFSKQLNQDATPANVTLDDEVSRDIIKSDGRDLVDRYWGRYVAFICDLDRNQRFAVRDPSGGFLCYRTVLDGVNVYFSNIEDICEIGRLKFSTNWDQILSDLTMIELANGRTGLTEVNELVPGECNAIIDGSCTSRLYWDPREICQSNIIFDVDDACSLLRSTTQACVNAWSSTYPSIIHHLSGGLDSAIVLGCMAKAPIQPKVVCVNYYTATEQGDERVYAKLAADQAGYEYIDYELQGAAKQLESLVSKPPLLPSPAIPILGSQVDPVESRIAEERDVQAFTSGEGGDHIFYQMGLTQIAADHVRNHGLSLHLLRVAFDTAQLTKKSFWSVMSTAVTNGLLRRPWTLQNEQAYAMELPAFLKKECVDALPSDYASHPWSRGTAGIPPGKLAQILILPGLLARHHPFGRSELADVLHPLFSQPIVDLCLRIPSYVLTTGSRNRGLARLAFANDIPREILVRRSKGVTSNYFSRMCVENLSFLREYLLDGLLARQEMIDRQGLDRTLSLEAIEHIENLRPILKLIVTEAWLKSWAETRRKAAA